MATEVRWCFGATDFVDDHRQLVSDPLLDRQPVQSAKQRLGVGSIHHRLTAKQTTSTVFACLFNEILKIKTFKKLKLQDCLDCA